MQLTVEQFKDVLPPQVKKNVNQEVMDIVNNVIGDPEYIQDFRENLVGYSSVLTEGKFKLTQYVEAVKYVSHKLMGCKNAEAYKKAFPEKMAEFARRNVDPQNISRYITAYNKSKLVNLIFAQSLIPTHVLNADVYQEAINIQLEIARTSKSDKVRSDAANSLMVQLRPPEVKKIELDMKVKEDSSIAQLRNTTLELVAQTKLAIQAGAMTAQQAAHQTLIIEGELDD